MIEVTAQYLKFTDEAEAETALSTVGIMKDSDGQWPDGGVANGFQFALSLHNGNGTFYVNGPKIIVDPETGNAWPGKILLAGFYVDLNWVGQSPEGLEAYDMNPATPDVVWS